MFKLFIYKIEKSIKRLFGNIDGKLGWKSYQKDNEKFNGVYVLESEEKVEEDTDLNTKEKVDENTDVKSDWRTCNSKMELISNNIEDLRNIVYLVAADTNKLVRFQSRLSDDVESVFDELEQNNAVLLEMKESIEKLKTGLYDIYSNKKILDMLDLICICMDTLDGMSVVIDKRDKAFKKFSRGFHETTDMSDSIDKHYSPGTSDILDIPDKPEYEPEVESEEEEYDPEITDQPEGESEGESEYKPEYEPEVESEEEEYDPEITDQPEGESEGESEYKPEYEQEEESEEEENDPKITDQPEGESEYEPVLSGIPDSMDENIQDNMQNNMQDNIQDEIQDEIIEGLGKQLSMAKAMLNEAASGTGIIITGNEEFFDPRIHEAISIKRVVGKTHRQILSTERKGLIYENRIFRKAWVTVNSTEKNQ